MVGFLKGSTFFKKKCKQTAEKDMQTSLKT